MQPQLGRIEPETAHRFGILRRWNRPKSALSCSLVVSVVRTTTLNQFKSMSTFMGRSGSFMTRLPRRYARFSFPALLMAALVGGMLRLRTKQKSHLKASLRQ